MSPIAMRSILPLLAAASVLALVSPALALERGTLRDILSGPARGMSGPPPSARYAVESGSASFVFDVAPGGPAYLKFEGSPEIVALRPTPGPRGDVIYKNDMDVPVVRTTRLGGVTVFTATQPDGMPAAVIGQAPPPRMPLDMGPEALWNVFVEASARATRAAQHLVVFEGPDDITPSTAPVYADAAMVVSLAFTQVRAKVKCPRNPLARYARVTFEAGRNPSIIASGEVVRVVVCPDQGVAGRPSSLRAATVMMAR